MNQSPAAFFTRVRFNRSRFVELEDSHSRTELILGVHVSIYSSRLKAATFRIDPREISPYRLHAICAPCLYVVS